MALEAVSDWKTNPLLNTDIGDKKLDDNSDRDAKIRELMSQIAVLFEAKLASVVSVKDFGATGDGSTDDTTALQNALDYAWTNGGLSVYVPAGTYKHSGLEITAPQGSPYYNKKRLIFYGDGPGVSILEHTGTGVAIDIVGETDTTSGVYGVTITGLGLTDNANTTHQIQLQYGTGYRLDNLYIEANSNGINIPSGLWLSRFTNINITGAPEYGIKMGAGGTSNYFDQIYVYGATVSAYELHGTYSTIGALAADYCTGTSVYDFSYFAGRAASLGCENCNVTSIVTADHSTVDVGFLYIYEATVSSTKGRPIYCSSGAISVKMINIVGTGGTTVSQSLFEEANGQVEIGYVSSDWTFTDQWGNSADTDGFAIIANKNAPVALRQAGARAYLGLDRKAQGKDTLDDGGIVHSVAIFLDCDGEPRYTSDGTDRRYQVGAKVGDWFIEGDPATNWAAGYVVTQESADLNAVKPKAIPLVLSGTTAQRPTIPAGTVRVGISYFDTTLGKPIWWDGSGWVDATGTSA